MTGDQVKQILGPPNLSNPDTSSVTDRNGVRTILHPSRITYIYYRVTPCRSVASKLYVHLDDNQVVEVYGKINNLLGLDDQGVYGLGIKDDNKKSRWESKYFSRAFPESN